MSLPYPPSAAFRHLAVLSPLAGLLLGLTACAPVLGLPNAPSSSETVNRMANLFLQSCVANRDSFAATKRVFDQYEFSADAGFGNIVSYVDTENLLLASLGEVETTTKSGSRTLKPVTETFCSVGSPNVSAAQAKQALDQIAAQTLSNPVIITGTRASRSEGLEYLISPALDDPEATNFVLAVTIDEIPYADFFLEGGITPQTDVPTFTTYNLAVLQSR